MIRPVLAAALLAVALVPGAPAAAAPTPVPYDPLPTSYDQLPQGGPTSLPWWQAGRLHVGTTTLRTQLRELAARNGTVVLGSGWSHPGRRSTAVLVRGSKLVHLPIAGHIRGPELSADGHWIAWLDEQETRLSDDLDRVRYRLVLYDAITRRVVAQHRETRRVEHEDGINGLSLISVANTGQVLFGRGRAGPHVLAPGREPVRLKGRRGQLRDWDGWPLGITVFRSRHGEDRGVYGTVSRRGRFHRVGATSYAFGSWSPGAEGFAFELEGFFKNTYWVDRPGTGTVVQLGLPGHRDLHVVGWESASSVLLWDANEHAEPPYSSLVRCDSTTGACQRVEGGPVAGKYAVFG